MAFFPNAIAQKLSRVKIRPGNSWIPNRCPQIRLHENAACPDCAGILIVRARLIKHHLQSDPWSDLLGTSLATNLFRPLGEIGD